MRYIALLVLASLSLIRVESSTAADWLYHVKPGDTIWDLCQQYTSRPDCWQVLPPYNRVTELTTMPPGLLLRFPAQWLKQQPAPARVLHTNGEVTFRRANTLHDQALTTDIRLHIGDRVITHSGSASITFADESILLMEPESELVMDVLSIHRNHNMVDTKVRLDRGKINIKVKPFRRQSPNFEVSTPAAIAAVRGTQFRIEYQHPSTEPALTPVMRSEVVHGSVMVSAQNAEESVGAGYGNQVTLGEAPSPPQLLPVAPKWIDIPNEKVLGDYTFKWHATPESSQYKLTLYADIDANQQIFSTTLTQTQFSLSMISASASDQKALNSGQYLIAIRGINKAGFEGLDSSLTFDYKQAPPSLPQTPPKSCFLKKGCRRSLLGILAAVIIIPLL